MGLPAAISEVEFRRRVQATFDRIEGALSEIDPDLAECDQSLGTLVILFRDGSRCILSVQPSVRQLWLALASRGTAHHFDLDVSDGSWKDDKDRGLELLDCLGSVLKEATGLELDFGPGGRTGDG
jgi:iron donor protein CyaY